MTSNFEFERGREAGIAWGERQERKRLTELLLDEDRLNAEYWADEKDGTVEAIVDVLRKTYLRGFYAAIHYLEDVQHSCEDEEDASKLDIPIELLKGEIDYPENDN